MDPDHKYSLHKRVELYRLILAADSIHSAQQALEIAIKDTISFGDDLFSIFHNSVVACYARAFTEMKPFGRISAKWEKFEDKRYAHVHQLLMEQRHKNVSHIDYLERKVVIYPPGGLKEEGYDSDDLLYVVKQEYYSAQDYKIMLDHMIALRNRMSEKSSLLLDEIYPRPSELQGPIELIAAEDVARLSK
jgi:hypothetical protein